MPRVIHFELPADSLERAIHFYSTVFGWKIEKWESLPDYWTVTTGDGRQAGIDGAITKRTKVLTGAINTIEVPSVDDYIKKVKVAGGQVVLPKIAVPGVGWMAYLRDTEGNVFGIIHPDERAK